MKIRDHKIFVIKVEFLAAEMVGDPPGSGELAPTGRMFPQSRQLTIVAPSRAYCDVWVANWGAYLPAFQVASVAEQSLDGIVSLGTY